VCVCGACVWYMCDMCVCVCGVHVSVCVCLCVFVQCVYTSVCVWWVCLCVCMCVHMCDHMCAHDCVHVDICFKHEPLESVREFWADQLFDEGQVNSALRRNGNKLLLSDKPRTLQLREPMSISDMVRERYYWGRNYGQSRVLDLSIKARLMLCLGMPILPLFLYARHFRRQLGKGHIGKFIIATPALIFLLLFWTMGEFMGYVEGTPADRFGMQ